MYCSQTVKYFDSVKTKDNLGPIVIGGFIPLTTIDFPDHLAAVVFCQGCPLNCHYCHNQYLIPKKASVDSQLYHWEDITKFLQRRVGLLDAIVFSGGEPTMQLGLTTAMIDIKNLGFKVGIHTSGIYPNRLKKLLPYLDWVGMDIKAPIDEYHTITTINNIGQQIIKSVKIILSSNIPYEFRTTFHPKLLNLKQLKEIVSMLKELGAKKYKVQQFRSEGCVNAALNAYDIPKNFQINWDLLNNSNSLDLFLDFFNGQSIN